ncbi:MAG: flagellar basal body P-ring formation chaperone FlgA [Candidatus Devosia phytovorans]|uniref:Flagellar basal body P-ring formation chaperone FlgA n=1 Tax=Candidatus Devosia phytovorans TaxID=3121372 RepID=A0AAJ5VVA3_9HYPH|nr:flagellar basal body P-ring formation chaperone FlgA [Devosia sp.]WEK05548.1 MAG: flagellar basal body P-ring formation chaperone FlgA [Devosia sp.]
MKLRSALATLSTLLLANTAFAAPVLRSDIMVSAPLVTVGDMFEDAGTQAETALFRSPQPGTSGQVPLADVTAAMTRIGLAQFDAAGVTAIRVTRTAAVVDEAALNDLITQDLTARGIVTGDMSLDTLFTPAFTPVNAEDVANPVSVISLRYLPGNGAFTARFSIAGKAEPVDVSGTIELMVEAPHITTTLPAGALLAADNIEMRPVPLKYVENQGTVRFEDVIGKTLTRQSRQGMMLRPSDVSVPATIAKNDAVTIYFRKGLMTLSVKGQAVTSAAQGAPVQVLNLMSKRVISATAIAPGAVEVGNDPLALAGL